MSAESCSDARRKFLIIGGGAFGLSTAWRHLQNGHNDVTICDHPDDIAPSRDVSKICRIDYPDPERMKETIRSELLWESDPLFQPFHNCTSRVVAYPKTQIDTLRGIERARSHLGLSARGRQPPQLLNELFDSTQVAEDLTVVFNEDDSILDWTGVMKSLKEDCVNNGGVFRRRSSNSHGGRHERKGPNRCDLDRVN